MRVRGVVVVAAMAGTFFWPTAADAAVITCDGRRATIVGTSQDEVITGTPRSDVIAARGGSDTVYGRGGNDRICGGYGADRLNGGPDDDRLNGGMDRISETDEETSRTGDTLRGGSGSDRLVPGRDTRPADDIGFDAIVWDTSPRKVRIDMAAGIATGNGRDSFDSRAAWVIGSPFGDTIEGSNGRDRIDGDRGSDVISGRRGNDRIVTDRGTGETGGRDVVSGGRDDDQITSGAGRDYVHGGRGDDVIDDFGRSSDRLYGGKGRDFLIGQLWTGEKPQVLWGGPGVDRVSLFTTALNPAASASEGTWNIASGRLVFELDQPVVATVGSFRDADLSSYGTTWVVRGTDHADNLNAAGTAGTTFRTLGGDDSFFGSASDDVFDGGPGTDHSLGMGVGDDTCISVEQDDQPADCETVLP
ncbi:MAG: hypothetical protein GEV07_18480 [Streptosporangiales bacterium]|nr:hypothetical protein [Streptosporangiales bacterium]